VQKNARVPLLWRRGRPQSSRREHGWRWFFRLGEGLNPPGDARRQRNALTDGLVCVGHECILHQLAPVCTKARISAQRTQRKRSGAGGRRVDFGNILGKQFGIARRRRVPALDLRGRQGTRLVSEGCVRLASACFEEASTRKGSKAASIGTLLSLRRIGARRSDQTPRTLTLI
jgi:hypothetical protein